MSERSLRVAFLIGRDSPTIQASIARICAMPGIEPVAVLLDTARPSSGQRWRNLRRNIGREGMGYLFYRAASALRAKLERWADQVISQKEVEELLRTAFPERGLDRLAARYGFRIIEAGNLNSPAAARQLSAAKADLGIVLGTRVLKRTTFSMPAQGCINLHKGKVPEYRGTPPGFWELYDGRSNAGITVHFVDDGLDTGDIVEIGEIPIHPKETPESLRAKLDQEGTEVLAEAVEGIRRGKAQRQPQPLSGGKPRTRPSRAQRQELARKLPHWRALGDGWQAIKIAFWLVLFHGGVYNLVRKLRHRNRCGILLYHRVNDMSEDVLTTNTRRFAQHLVTLRRYYSVISTEDLVERIRLKKPMEPSCAVIHFDDCYRDVRQYATPLLAAAGMPATAFVSSGFVDTDRVFPHDEARSPHRFENLRAGDIREMQDMGVSIAAHTVNHVDLGAVTLEQAQREVVDSRQQLEQVLTCPVLLFSFPFGRYRNICGEVREMVKAAGYSGLFSAYGGFVDDSTQLFDIPRFGVSSDHSPLALLMAFEGITSAHWKHKLTPPPQNMGFQGAENATDCRNSE